MFKKGDLVFREGLRRAFGLGVVIECPADGCNSCKIRWAKPAFGFLWVHTCDLRLVSRAKKNV
tara:strand:+ start:564 stop:752 length:189 start_codon:yes stop_codon:yes gene_type:complete